MKRLFVIILGLAALILGVGLLVNAVNLQTDRADRWAMIFSFATVMFVVGVMSSTTTPTDAATAPVDEVDAERSRRIVPAAPGSLKNDNTLRVPQRVAEPGVALAPPPPAPPTSGSTSQKAPQTPPPAWTTLRHRPAVATASEPTHAPERTAVADSDETDSDVVDSEVVEPDAVEPVTVGDAMVDSTVTDPAVADSTVADSTVADSTVADSVAVGDAPSPAPLVADTAPVNHDPVAADDEPAEKPSVVVVHTDAAVDRNARAEADAIHRMAARGEVSTAGPLTTQDLAMMLFLSQADDHIVGELATRSDPGDVIDLRDSVVANQDRSIAG